MKRVLLVLSLLALVGVVAFAQQDQAKPPKGGNDRHDLLSNLKAGEWISFDSGNQGITIRVIEKSQDLSIDAWHEQYQSLIRERNQLMEPFQPRRALNASKEERAKPRPADFEEKRQQAQAKADEIEAKLQTYGVRPYEITGVREDHLAVRDKTTEYFLPAAAIRYITRVREE
jgi:hypothetical protein